MGKFCNNNYYFSLSNTVNYNIIDFSLSQFYKYFCSTFVYEILNHHHTQSMNLLFLFKRYEKMYPGFKV